MKQLKHLLFSAAAGSLLAFGGQSLAADSTADLVSAALNDSNRPENDSADDDRRMPLEVLAFAGLQAGMSVMELEAGGGYYTEILSRTVGADGSVIMHNPAAFDNFLGDAVEIRLGANRLPNVRHTKSNFDELDAPDNSIDLVTWILGPHELWFHPAENVSFGDPDKAFAEIKRVLKPGGSVLLIDHRAAADAGPEVGGTLHRIGEGIISDMAEAAGLTLTRSSNLHANADDPLDNGVFDPTIQGKTSKFVLLYRN